MLKILTFLFLVIISVDIKAQPGYVLVNKNINDYSQSEIEKSKTPMQSYRKYGYILNNNTNLSNIQKLRSLHHITLTANVKALPKELWFMADSLKELTLQAGSELIDISALGELKNLESIKLINYNGSSLPALNTLTSLKRLTVTADFYKGDNLKHISGVASCKSLKYLALNYSSLKKLDVDMAEMNLDELAISGCNSLQNIDAIIGSTSLKTLQLYGIPIKKLPDNMNKMTALESLSLTGMSNLTDINSLAGMANLKSFYLNISHTGLTNIPKSFNTNLNIEKIVIDVVYGYKLKSADGLTYLKNLRTIVIRFPEFQLPLDFNTCKNLESIELVGADSVSISRINGLDKLKKIELSNCNFSKIPVDFYTNKNLEELSIVYNNKLCDIRDIVQLKKLRMLTLMNNAALTLTPDFKKSMPFLNQFTTLNQKN